MIDCHCHILTPAVEALVQGHPSRLEEIATTRAHQGEASARHNQQVVLPDCQRKMTNIAERLAAMDAMGVDIQVLSPSPGQYYYWAEPDLAEQIVRLQNDHIADVVATHPDRFAGLGMVSLQHPLLATRQLDHAVRTLGLRGVEISSAAGGRELGDPALDGFWAKAEELGAAIFIHPLGSSLGERLNRAYLANIVGQPVETTIALSHLIFAGVMDRHPELKLLAAHGGGYLPSYPERSDHGWRVRPEAAAIDGAPSEYLRRMWFDNLVYTPEAVRLLIDRVGADRVLVGTDYPFDMGSYDARALVEAIKDLSDAERHAILCGNALRLFTTRFNSNDALAHAQIPPNLTTGE